MISLRLFILICVIVWCAFGVYWHAIEDIFLNLHSKEELKKAIAEKHGIEPSCASQFAKGTGWNQKYSIVIIILVEIICTFSNFDEINYFISTH
jgi:hypothetical protein